MEPEIEVWHFLLAREARVDESWRTANLRQPASYAMRGVGYVLQVNPDVEFPTDVKPPGAVYLRARGNRTGPLCILFQVAHRNSRGAWTLHSSIPMRTTHPIPFSESDDEVRETVVQLPYLRVGGAGLNAISVSFCAFDQLPVDDGLLEPIEIPDWQTDPAEMFGSDGWRFGAVEYLWVERTS